MEKDFKPWKLKEQTHIKHLVLKCYLDKWVKILGKSYSTIYYIDGFSGPGEYENPLDESKTVKEGSPVIGAEIARTNKATLNRNVKIILIDIKGSSLAHSKGILDREFPDISATYINGDFDVEINKLLDESDLSETPAFVFIDPFGVTSVKMSTIEKIMRSKRKEVLILFMFNFVNRFLIDSVKKTLNDLFGTDKWKDISHLHGERREKAIIDIYRNQLKSFSRFVFPYRFSFPHKDRTLYYLFHLTHNLKGMSIMKSCFAEFNEGEVEYVGKNKGTIYLFDIRKMKISDLKELLKKEYEGRIKTFRDIIEEKIDETNYLEKDFKQAIKELEKDGYVYIDRRPRFTEKRKILRKSIENNDYIYFNTFPSITRKSLLYKTKVEYGNYTINHVFGCAHGCKFPCYAMMLAKRYGKINDYEQWLHPQLVSNALELLEKEIPKYKKDIKFVHLSFTTDPFMYDALNKRTIPWIKKATLGIIEELNKNGVKCTVLTKGIYPDDLLDVDKFSSQNEYGITLISLNKEFKKKFEPYSAPYDKRIAALRKLSENGLKTWASLEPYPTPNLVEQNIEEILSSISFVDKIIFGKINYNSVSNSFEDNEGFYKETANKVVEFCKKHNIRYHIKHGTPNEYNGNTENIFSD